MKADGSSKRDRTKNVTLHDVARLAGVGTMTVSRALNNPELLNTETLRTVREAIEITGYVPNLMARGFATNRNRLIGAFFPSSKNLIYAELIESLNIAFNAEGYRLLLGVTGFSASEEDVFFEIFALRPEAFILTGVSHSPKIRQHLLKMRVPVVEIWDYSTSPIDMLVGFSREKLGAAVGEFFLGKGFRHVGLIGGGDSRTISRFQFAEETLKRGGAKVVTKIMKAPASFRFGREALFALKEELPGLDAVFCSSDSLAHGVLTGAQVMGIDVPRDLAILGFGDFDFSAYTAPALSTIRIDYQRLAATTSDFILKRLSDVDVPQKIVDLGFQIIEREST